MLIFVDDLLCLTLFKFLNDCLSTCTENDDDDDDDDDVYSGVDDDEDNDDSYDNTLTNRSMTRY